ncbi:MAG: double zinc ribbon domain-containing protein, partial [Pseudomonadota bacterium]
MQSVLKIIFPTQCIGCGVLVEDEGALCGSCWRDTPFVVGANCAQCGIGLRGHAPGDTDALCDDCLKIARPWRRGVAVFHYAGAGRRLVLALKHGDRLDLAAPLGRWMLERARPIIVPGTVVVPVPIPWRRMVKRRFNQSAELARHLAQAGGLHYVPDALR